MSNEELLAIYKVLCWINQLSRVDLADLKDYFGWTGDQTEFARMLGKIRDKLTPADETA